MANLGTTRMRAGAAALFAGLVWLALAGGASAQEEAYGPDQSDYLLGFNATYSYSKADDVGSSSDELERFNARVGLGWFYRRTHEIGVDLAPDFARTEQGGDTRLITLAPYYNYNHWSSPRTTLYAGPHLGVTWVDASDVEADTAFSYGLQCGLRYWVSPNVSLNVEPRLTFSDQEEELGGDTTNFDILFGVEFKL